MIKRGDELSVTNNSSSSSSSSLSAFSFTSLKASTTKKLTITRPWHGDIDDEETKKLIQEAMPEIEEAKFKKAMILVGGIVTTGEKKAAAGQRSKLQKEKTKKVRDCLNIIKERTPGAFDKREFMIGTYAITKMTYGCGVNMNTISQNNKLAGTVHNVLTNKKTRWKCREISLTCHVKGHLVEPWQAERYTVVRTMRRIMIKDQNLGRNSQKNGLTTSKEKGKGIDGRHTDLFRYWQKC